MPSYTWLRPLAHDDLETLRTKQRATQKIKALRSALEKHILDAGDSPEAQRPSDITRYVRIATWNIREFDSASYGYRTDEAKAYIAEILSHFDLVALQEVRRDLKSLEDIRGLLGPNWDYVATDVTGGASGNKERMAFLFNRDKVWFRNVAGELTLPKGQKITDPFGERFRIAGGVHCELPPGSTLESPQDLRTSVLASGETRLDEDVEIPFPEQSKIMLPPGSTLRFAKNARLPVTDTGAIAIEPGSAPHLPEAAEIVLPPNSLVGGVKQFARTPFVASFQAGWLKINLTTVHIYYGSGRIGIDRRQEEIQRLTQLLGERAESEHDSDADSFFIALGDFNIVHPEHRTMEALLSHGFVIPAPLQHVPGTNVKQDKYYDQIALWEGTSKRRKGCTSILPFRAGVFDFFDIVYTSEEENVYRPFMQKIDSEDFYASYSTWRTYQMSDHLPMWVELKVDFAQEYLEDVESALRERIEE